MTRWILLTTSPIIFWGSGNNIFVDIEEGVGDHLFKLIWHEMSYTFRRTVCDQRDSRNTPDFHITKEKNKCIKLRSSWRQWVKPTFPLSFLPTHHRISYYQVWWYCHNRCQCRGGFCFSWMNVLLLLLKDAKKLEGSGQLETLIGLYGKFQKQNTLLLIKRVVVNQLRLEWTRPHLHFRGPMIVGGRGSPYAMSTIPADSI